MKTVIIPAGQQVHVTTADTDEKVIQFVLEAGAVLDHELHLHDGSYQFSYLCVGADARVKIRGMYKLIAQQHVSIETIQHHKASNTHSDLLVKGVLFDQAQVSFTGRIIVDQDCPAVDAQMHNKSLLLSSDVRVHSRPILEVFSDDVSCAHGCAVGQLDADQVRYLMSRGFGPAQAEKLLIQAFLQS